MARTAVAFDLYGTLLSTESIARHLARLYGDERAKAIAAQARRYQLEYTWRINSMGAYRSFSDLTRWSFRQATAEAGVQLTPEQEEEIMDAYNGLDTFPEVGKALTTLAETPSLDPYIFSNGTVSMITSSLKTSPSLARASNVLPPAKVVSVDPLKVFKPDPRTYQHMAKTAGFEGQLGSVWLVSSNPFDVAGAVAAGLKAAWVDRAGGGWVDGLGGATDIKPTVIVKGVDEAVGQILRCDMSSTTHRIAWCGTSLERGPATCGTPTAPGLKRRAGIVEGLNADSPSARHITRGRVAHDVYPAIQPRFALAWAPPIAAQTSCRRIRSAIVHHVAVLAPGHGASGQNPNAFCAGTPICADAHDVFRDSVGNAQEAQPHPVVDAFVRFLSPVLDGMAGIIDLETGLHARPLPEGLRDPWTMEGRNDPRCHRGEGSAIDFGG
ncbi:hypothetical protein PCL_10791 [Purpureocillium lilacinum]|uniref:Haloacid dehalogenase n=1 Tax=Purpureocillium lilacinum TaxID=33203 RepID=A0A2U3ECE1_PURLI|nr:hypothetical protein PCL_10791 [Purpureocillium lilacinum]